MVRSSHLTAHLTVHTWGFASMIKIGDSDTRQYSFKIRNVRKGLQLRFVVVVISSLLGHALCVETWLLAGVLGFLGKVDCEV